MIILKKGQKLNLKIMIFLMKALTNQKIKFLKNNNNKVNKYKIILTLKMMTVKILKLGIKITKINLNKIVQKLVIFQMIYKIWRKFAKIIKILK